MQRKWILRLVTALSWALAAASTVYWILRLATPAPGPSAPVAVSSPGTGDSAARKTAIARLLGAQPTQTTLVAAASRFSLAGVVAQGSGGAALLVVDGKPARPYRVGSRIDDNTVLRSVGPRHAVLSSGSEGSSLQQLDLPPEASLKGITVVGANPAGRVPTAKPLP